MMPLYAGTVSPDLIPEFELIDTGVFNENRYFDVYVEYAKAAPDDILIRITVFNRGDSDAEIHLLPTLWFRNTWSWIPGSLKPVLNKIKSKKGMTIVSANHPELGEQWLCSEGDSPLLFTENETNNKRIFGSENSTPYVKDSINDYVVHGDYFSCKSCRYRNKSVCTQHPQGKGRREISYEASAHGTTG